jgi:serine/threonine protein kinase
VEFTLFNEALSVDDSDILKGRVRQLCEVLAGLDRPSTLLLPLSLGFLQYRRTQFVLAYKLPEFADPHRDTVSLYSIIRPNKRSVHELKSKQLWPTLEQRYLLAAVLAEGLLSLLNVDWVHKSLNSANIVMYHEKGSVHAVDLSRPQMMGFGFARPEKPGERTIDVRSLNSPLSLWQHPELRQGPHRRYERRYDIYSLGMILFEIGMWQDLHYFSNRRDSAFDFHQRVLNVCHSQLAHHMGEAYRDTVLLCIDRDDLWVATREKEEGNSALLELFSWEVVRGLKRCSAGMKVV